VSENKYDRIPEDMREDARDYVEDHEPVGGFLYAVLTNDLVNAFGYADPDNRAAMHDWCLWLFNDIPSKCWGSKEKVEAWLAYHPAATLTGGSVPAHRPGAYQNLSCCGGETKLVEVSR
jgi:hypothetical protein